MVSSGFFTISVRSRAVMVDLYCFDDPYDDEDDIVIGDSIYFTDVAMQKTCCSLTSIEFFFFID